MGGLIFLAICIGMAVDASNIGYDGDDVPGFAPGPVGWFFLALLLSPIIAVPVYLIRRPALKEAAQRRRLQAQTFAALPGAVHGAYAAAYGQPQNPYGGQAPYPGQPQYPGQAPYAGRPSHGGYPGQPPQAPYPAGPPQAGYPGAPPRGPYPGQPPQAPYGSAPPPQNPYGGPPPQNPYGGAPQPAQPQQPQPAASPYGAAPQPAAAPQAPSPQPAAPQAPAPPSSGTTPAADKPHAGSSGSMTAGDLADGIRQLSDLRDRGLLTEAEFQTRKASLLRKV